MEVRAVAKYVRVQPRKVRIVADEVRGASATKAAALLQYHPSKSAHALRKVLISAVANAIENHELNPEALRIRTIMVDEGPKLKRMQARAMGRGNRIEKKTSHITVIVEDFEAPIQTKAKPTKAKARPTFKVKGGSKKAAAPAVEEAKVEEVVGEVVETTQEPVAEAEVASEAVEATETTGDQENK